MFGTEFAFEAAENTCEAAESTCESAVGAHRVRSVVFHITGCLETPLFTFLAEDRDILQITKMEN